MPLEEYRSKRNFSSTSEPEGSESGRGEGLRFVVQRHRASRLHYDLRLEMGGVLKSWAVPKGPSMNPSDKRLAIQTEDHPVEYLHFEGIIPKGNYGAGEMLIWDNGTYKPAEEGKKPKAGWHNGNLKIILKGKKLKGEFALVKTDRGEEQNQWLLIKKKDEYATDLDYDAENWVDDTDQDDGDEQGESNAAILDLNEMVKPMLASPANKVVERKGWIYEIKWDGYRALANVNSGNVHLYSRNGITLNHKFQSIISSLKGLDHEAILDGEIVALDEMGLPQFQTLQNYDPNRDGELRYYVFDLLYLNGHSLMHLPLIDRKSLLPELLQELKAVYYCEHVDEMGLQFYESAVEQGLEGIIAKKEDSEYRPGFRSDHWLKVKAVQSVEALICGYTESDKQTHFGSLILGSFKDEELVYIGNCGSGFNEDTRRQLFEQMEPLMTDKNPFEDKINLKGRKPHWLKPELIAEVKFSEKTKKGLLRHPVFKGLREDKTKSEIRIATEDKAITKATSVPQVIEVGDVKVPFSNLDKVFWPGEGLRKYDVIDYYLQMSDVVLPYLKDRPQNLHRHPNGINKEGFYHKDTGDIMPHWVESVKLYSQSAGKNIDYLLCQDEPTLLYMAQLGCIEINPWNSRKDSIDHPDYAVIDLDPSAENSFEEVVEVALASKEVLDKAGIESFCKTSGSRGLHIYLPLNGQYSYEQARDFTKLLCHLVQQHLPKLTTLERSLKKRNGRIYLDYLQNRKGQTLAAPYCLRPKRGAPVSTPLLWEEVNTGLDKGAFNIHTVPKRVEQKGDLFKGVLQRAMDMEAALEKLGEG